MLRVDREMGMRSMVKDGDEWQGAWYCREVSEVAIDPRHGADLHEREWLRTWRDVNMR